MWRRREQPQLDDREWDAALAACPLLAGLGAGDRARVRELAGAFLAEKSLEGASGFEVSTAMAVSIAAQACVPLIGLDLRWYRGWRSVIVYPGDFLVPHEHVDEAGVVHEYTRPLAGESWDRGPIVLSWEGVDATASGREWGNLVIHECAHKLDMLDGAVDGTPPLASAADRSRWAEVMSEAFDVLGEAVDSGALDSDDILADAADDPGEFFAVISEWLHVEPGSLRRELPEVYRELTAFYRRDPAEQR